ncbi:EF-P 5-aminopentanol modification-associated protein YfmF [Paenibacillus yanchengensis]|uniref:EF-P 5-aminopentanol modification-associated protein YfmF n=1 Tax=Paenibacillus yanchengensis TaxID=2035833 RepID=A0ABW4YM49_9BACL
MNVFQSGQVQRLRIHVLPTKRFKTFAISLYAGVPLEENTVTETALLPFVMRRGNAKLPETSLFRAKLDELYGAGFGFDIYKRGDSQIVQFSLDIINDQFVTTNESLLAQALQFLGDTVSSPYLPNGSFSTAYVEAEKDNIRKRLEAIVNDKIRYAAERCLEEMCEDDIYRLHPLGKQSDLLQITAQSLYNRYQDWLKEAAFDLYVVGDTTLAEVEKYVADSFNIKQGAPTLYSSTQLKTGPTEIKRVVEELDVGQGKLNMGLTTGLGYNDANYAALLMYNGILGGYPHSKLFLNVRERASLAYYAASRLDGHKGICTIQSGIEIAHYEQAVAIIEEQLEAMRAGALTDLEMEQTKAMLINQLREMQDSAFETIGYHFNQVFSGTKRSVEQLLQQVKDITKEDIVTVAEHVQLDTIYFLRDREEK